MSSRCLERPHRCPASAPRHSPRKKTAAAESKPEVKPQRKRRPLTAKEKKAVSARMTAYWAERRRVWLFFVGHPEGFGERHGKSYLTRRRRGEEGGGGGSVTGGTVPSV